MTTLLKTPRLIGLSAAALAALIATAPAQAGVDVGVSIGIAQPGVYGRIDIGRQPQPALVYTQPVVVAPAYIAQVRQPIYLYVPEVQQRDWRHWCGRYAACGQPVYFVRDDWVREQYAHRPHDYRGDRHDDRGHWDHRGDRDHDHDDRDHDRGRRDRDDRGDRGDHRGGRGHD